MLSALVGHAQNKGTVKGQVVDSLSALPLGYASIAIHAVGDNKLINGNLTDEQGKFTIEVPRGQYYAVINFVGYGASQSNPFTVSSDVLHVDLGTLFIKPKVDVLQEVVVQAQKSSMELSLDKKIFNVGQDLANSGGTASDILMNIPSVAVDPEGNVKLRGSDNVKILIDGKPSGLVSFKGGAGLQQLQASMIERVEVITNPSARYEAEGLGGIINIVLKKEKNEGFNGSIDVITGHPTNYGLAANLNYRRKKINFFINYGFAYRDQPGRSSMYQETYVNDTTFILDQTNQSTMKGLNNNIRGGIDYYFSEKSILTGSYLFRRSDAKRLTDIVYKDYLFSKDHMVDYSTRRQDETEAEPNSEYSLIYKKIFPGKGHELLTEVKYLDNWESSDQTFTQHFFQPDGTEDASQAILQKSLNDESEKQFLVQVDYTRPIAKEGKLEGGFRRSDRNMINDYVVTQQNPDGSFSVVGDLDNIFYYDETITAAYGILGNKSKWFSYQAGLRAEWTDVKTTLQKTSEVNPRKYNNLFPSVHVTFALPKENSLQLSYSRRVRRPFYNDLSPFMTYSDSRNYFSGNPDLNPEFSNVIEVGHMKYFESGSLSSSLYSRSTNDKIDQIRIVDENGNATTMPRNLLSEKAYGLEVSGTFDITKWWKFDANANFFYASVDGSNIESGYKTTTYSWFARQTSRFSLPANIDFQLRMNYEAPQKTVQGSRKALKYMDVSFSKDIFKGKGTLNLNILDVFNSRIQRSVAEGEIFYSDRSNQFRRRQINLAVSYRINRVKSARKQREETVAD
ncbi:TonB-dependent receptor [Chryseolinea sp. Jin1]|uniref:TonB-dependent receptor n=1 Tax=Chryseolinea lacunae TaxID=2801331 RepID=A0ABS1KWE2_9BACT|nr:TonB-dependent receptor [Chryseolinea lacunae]